MTHHPGNLLHAVSSIVGHRRLILDLTRREVAGRYRGSVGSLLWSFAHPLLMLAVYTFVFAVVFKARWGGATHDAQGGSFAVILFMGLIVHGLFADCINRSPTVILANVNYVKRVIFPLEILPVVALGTAIFHAAVSLVILLAFQLATMGRIEVQVLWLPVVLAPLLLLTLGVSWFLAATGVYLRDVGQVTGVLTTVLLFLSPVFYPASALPEEYRRWLHLNPLTFVIEQARAVVLWGQTPDLSGLLVYLAFALLAVAVGFWWFQRSRPGFADVL